MNRKFFCWLATLTLVTLLCAAAALGQQPTQVRFSGSIDDFTPANGTPAGPWKVHGDWTLALQGDSGKADFSATLTMVRSDLWVIMTAADPNNPAARIPHTHHITITDASVTQLSNGIEVSGPATITANGTAAGFSGSHVVVDVTGGADVPFSNIKVTFLDGAQGHFGPQPLEGVVHTPKKSD